MTGLPGALEALGDDLLEAIGPRLIVVADSEFPSSARARPSFCERLGRRQVPVVYTRWEGATTLELRRGRWELTTMGGLRLTGAAQIPKTAAAPGG